MSDTLATQARLADIRLRVLNREPVSIDEYRNILSDLRRDRDNTSRTARSATAAKSRAAKSAAKSPQSLDLNTLFGVSSKE